MRPGGHQMALETNNRVWQGGSLHGIGEDYHAMGIMTRRNPTRSGLRVTAERRDQRIEQLDRFYVRAWLQHPIRY